MILLRGAALPALAGLGIALFVLRALPRASGAGATFGAAFLGLVFAACAGPFLFGLRGAARRGAWLAGGLRGAAWIAAAMAAACGAVAAARGAAVGPGVLAGLFCGLYALAAGALGGSTGTAGRLVVAGLALALSATLFFWDDLFLQGASDRKASVALAFALNPAAAASTTLGFDWIHAKALYTGNETAESLVGVPLGGIGAYAWKLALVAGLALAAGAGRRR